MNATQALAPARIHVIFKTHLDVGFTDYSDNVVQNYFHSYIPKAIKLARELREANYPERFIWTTGSWLIYQYLEQASTEERANMERAILEGDITWHGLPFTTHSENMDASLFTFGLSLSQELDRRFGRRTIAAKMTDVPGHTRGIVPLLAKAGVQFLHIGVNGASTAPDVPDVFNWLDPSGAQVMVMYHKGSYGALMTIPGLEDAIYFAHTGDNNGPQSPGELKQVYQNLQAEFPEANIFASTLDAFADRLAEVRASLPVVTLEIGDSWIHGVGTDPTKESRYRALLALRREWLKTGVPEKKIHGFSLGLLPISEHTWGLDVKTHLGDWENYSVSDFSAVLSGEKYQKMEASWQEQRNYLVQAVRALDDQDLRNQAEERLLLAAPSRPNQTAFEPISGSDETFETMHYAFTLEPRHGYITTLAQKDSGRDWSGAGHPLASFWHQTFSAVDYERFYQQYNKNKRYTREWAIPDFTKPGLDASGAESRSFLPLLDWMGFREDGEAAHYLLVYRMPDESWQLYGGPRLVTLNMDFASTEPSIAFDLQWFDKTVSRLPEAFWFSFMVQNNHPRNWRMDKLGEWISPYEVIHDGNRHLHAVNRGVNYEERGSLLSIQPVDSSLVAPGEPSLLNFTNEQPDLRQGVHFNLYNNAWGTNFPMWFGEDARFRFRWTIGNI